MRYRCVLAFFTLFFLAGVCRAEKDSKAFSEEAPRKKGGGGGYSQQYHYQSYPSQGQEQVQGQTYAGISFDLSTGLFLALGAIIILLSLATVYLPLLSKGDFGGGDGWGWRSYGSHRNLNLADMTEKVLNVVDKASELYNKNK